MTDHLATVLFEQEFQDENSTLYEAGLCVVLQEKAKYAPPSGAASSAAGKPAAKKAAAKKAAAKKKPPQSAKATPDDAGAKDGDNGGNAKKGGKKKKPAAKDDLDDELSKLGINPESDDGDVDSQEVGSGAGDDD